MPIFSSPNRAGPVAVAATLLLAALAVTGCASASHGTDTPAMNGGGMMGGSSRYSTSPSTCSSTPSSLPGTTVVVTLTDMGMTRMMSGVAPMSARMRLAESVSTVSSGQVSFVADNRGWRTHELVILPLAGGASAGRRTVGSDGKVSETGSLGEASANCAAGTGGGITAAAPHG